MIQEPHVEFLKEILTEENFEKYMKDPSSECLYMTGLTNILLNLQDLKAKSEEIDLLLNLQRICKS